MTAASDALANMRATASKGEVAGNWDDVVKVYKAAGQQGASVVGPAIDQLSGGNPQTTTLTHRAWVNNGLLANINSSDSATKEDADAAKRLCDSMIQDLQWALNLAQANPHPVAPFVAAANAMAPPGTPPHTVASAAMAYHAPAYTPPAYTPPPVQAPPAQTPPAHPDEMRDMKRFGPAVAGAGIGFAMGGPAGAAVGGGIGFVIGLIITSDKK
jgi:hypothetical protein